MSPVERGEQGRRERAPTLPAAGLAAPSSEESPAAAREPGPRQGAAARAPRRARPGWALLAGGEPLLWLTGGALALCLVMVVGLLLFVLDQGLRTFWPAPLRQVRTAGGAVQLGEVVRESDLRLTGEVLAALPPEQAERARSLLEDGRESARRWLLRTGNFELTGTHFEWVGELDVPLWSEPEWAVTLERVEWGRFHGIVTGLELGGEIVADDPAAAWALFEREHGPARARREERRRLETDDVGAVNHRLEAARLAEREALLDHGEGSAAWERARQRHAGVEAWAEGELTRIRTRIDALEAQNREQRLVLRTADGRPARIVLADVVRAFPANRLGAGERLRVYLSRWREFLGDDPREANSEGGVFPAIFGTVVMTLLMSLAVVPFGVLAALYLREYARAGFLLTLVRISINNLAGVPSIVFGVFGLGFFCYIVGAGVDQVFFEARLPNPTYGKGGILWAALTLALLTLPVVIVATEEALAAVPSSLREGSYACGAGKWQTIQRIVLPRALPGIMTGMILAMARGAGEVAPLMLVGAVKLAPELALDGLFPFLHPERSFMHLGFHVYDLGFQSQNSEAAKPMVFTTTVLLIAIVCTLNLAAIALRMRLRRRFVTSQF